LAKKRIHELAKEYGLTGKDLVVKLRDRGFSQIKSHMTAVDEIELLQIQAVLEAHGIVPISKEDEDDETLGGVILRKKKRKKLARPAEAFEEPAPAGSSEAFQAEPPAAGAAGAVAAPPGGVAAEAGAAAAPAPDAAPTAPAEVAPADGTAAAATAPRATEDATGEPAVERPHDLVSEGAEAGADADFAPTGAAAARVADAVAEAVAAEVAQEVEAVPSVEAGEPGAEEEPLDEASKLPLRQGKVLGFIDLSKLRTTQPRKSESRRLSSGDDVMPDVKPTLRHDPRRAMMRGDRGARNSLSAAELREKEAGRYLRRNRGPGASARDRRPRRDGATGSPHAGGEIKIETPITIKKLAEGMALKSNEVMQVAFRLLGFGTVKSVNDLLDEETAVLLAHEFDVELNIVHEIEAEEALIEGLKRKRSAVDGEHLATRHPTVAFLGHVDHGKTTLIDAIRNSSVAGGEDGGITQHIGAYCIETDRGHMLTILDTPGHAAFTGMRARGARAVDVVVLVVAVDAGVQPQTEEALAHARAAKSPIVVALTKIDRPEANVQRAMQQLAALGLNPEAWGGQTGMVEVSGITGQGLQDLLERVFLECEILELQCHPDSPATGVVLEAEVQLGRGIVAHLLVQDGTLRGGDVILAGEGYGKVRSIQDDHGVEIPEAGPSMPVEVSGLSALPGIGEPFHVVERLDEAKEVAEERARKSRTATLAERRKLGNLDLLEQVTGPGREHLNFIVRADVQGSAEVLQQSITDLSHAEVESRVLQCGVGAVTENDILLASTSNALVVAFRVGVNAQARQAAEREGVEIRNYTVLYEVLDNVRELLEGRLAPDVQEEITGHIEIRVIFKSSKVGNIAGCFVLDGTVRRDHRIRLLRDDTVIYSGALASLRREKDDVREVREGFECGVLLKGYDDIREGDVIEAYRTVEVKRTLSRTVGE